MSVKQAGRTILILAILFAAGPLSGAALQKDFSKETEAMEPAPPPCDRYPAGEWDISFWGSVASAGDPGNRRVAHIERGPENGTLNDIGHLSNNRLFGGEDNVWGGGLDVKYFFAEHWGLGLEGFLLDTTHTPTGAELATMTFRYPIGCSRFAPYGWAGIGALEGGSHTILVFSERNEVERTEFPKRFVSNQGALFLGQFGGGLEMRIIHPSAPGKLAVGLMADFAWNMADGPHNNFGLVRFGVNFAY